MKIFLIKNLLTEETQIAHKISELKQVTHHYSDLFEIFEIEGRKGSELNSRIREAESGNINPLWGKSYTPPTITRTRTEEHNKLISEKLSGRTLTETHKENISAALMGNQNHRL